MLLLSQVTSLIPVSVKVTISFGELFSIATIRTAVSDVTAGAAGQPAMLSLATGAGVPSAVTVAACAVAEDTRITAAPTPAAIRYIPLFIYLPPLL